MADARRVIATVCLSGTLEDKLAAAAAAGFDGIELFENDLVHSAWSPARIRRCCADLGLDIDLYQPFRDFEAVPPDVLRANLRRAEAKFDVMEQLGVDTMLVCSSVSPDAVDDDELAAEQLHLLASRAAERGIVLDGLHRHHDGTPVWFGIAFGYAACSRADLERSVADVARWRDREVAGEARAAR